MACASGVVNASIYVADMSFFFFSCGNVLQKILNPIVEFYLLNLTFEFFRSTVGCCYIPESLGIYRNIPELNYQRLNTIVR